MDSRHDQKFAPSVRPRRPRWKAWQCASTKAGELQSSPRAKIGLCGASWSWGWQGRVLPACTRARGDGRDLLLPW